MDNGLSQEEIDALLGLELNGSFGASEEEEMSLTKEESDALGEISNISMGTSATTLSSLVNQKVNITTPTVSVTSWEEFKDHYKKPCVAIEVQYKEGLIGTNFLILKDEDVKIITNLMMGGDGKSIDFSEEISELHLSAICEAMNQMVGSASTSMFSMFDKKIDILPPKAIVVDFDLDELPAKMQDTSLSQFVGDRFVQIQFNMVIGDIIDSVMMQIYPFEFAKELYANLMKSQGGNNESVVEETVIMNELGSARLETPVPPSAPTNAPPPIPAVNDLTQHQINDGGQRMENMNLDMNVSMSQNVSRNVDVQPVEFQEFSTSGVASQPQNIDLIMDVPLQVSVELGRTKKSIKEILDFSPGSVVELDKLAGDPVDILVNGKMVAKGEVVVIDENFAIRITDILNKKINLY